MKEGIVLLILFIITTSLHAQQLKGTVTDYKGRPCPSLEILVSNSQYQASTISSASGAFSITLPAKGNYLLLIKQQGQVLFQKEITVDSISIQKLTVNTSILDEVTVSTAIKKKTIERKTDRLIFNVENSISAAGGDLIDAIKITPGVKFVNDQLSLIGRSGVTVFIDNRPLQLPNEELIAYLKSIRADDVKSIEVISNPPAQYEAEGNSGIININLKKSGKQRWNGSATAAFRQSKYSSANESAQLSYNNKKLSAYGNIRHSMGTGFFRREEGEIDYPDKQYRSHSTLKSEQGKNLSLTTGLDYTFSKKISAGGQYIYSNNNVTNENTNNTYIYGQPNNLIQTPTNGKAENTNHNGNIHFAYQIDSTGSTINFNADYFSYRNPKSTLFSTREYEDFTRDIPEKYISADNRSYQNITNYAFQADVTQKRNGYEFNYGVKYSGIQSDSWFKYYDNTSGTPILDEGKSNEFDYKEHMQAAYLTGSRKWNKLELKAGIRLEHTTTEGYSASALTSKNNYTRLFPTLYAMYDVTSNVSAGINYGKRIQRPRYTTLNPFVRYINPYSTSQGNPLLQPYQTNNMELFLHYKDKWITNLHLSWSENVYEQLNHITPSNINAAFRYENFFDQLSFGLSETYTFYPVKRWESYNSADLYYREIKSSIPQTSPNCSSWSGYIESNNNLQLNKTRTLALSINYWYQFPEYYAVYYTKAYSCLSIGFRILLDNKKWTIALNSEDLLRNQRIKNNTSFNGLPSRNFNYEDRRCMRISLRYNFGSAQSGRKALNNSNEEERNRL
ncbi:outer membrane beta-barrel family protein [Filimonas effusa]|uniref:TonB-dependent receptor n=1 Tax=Filimonas effusa TaxID=2508721 RepID=A0A4V1M9Z3_9BACT|nr:outer membrane beta-barrel family protein [Filimonas effusa]RXK83374.1 TonB-dependent receptor [Filimonas effusa]